MAARVVGVRQEGIKSLPDGAVHEGRGTRAAAMTSWAGAKCASCELPRWSCAIEKKKLNKSKPRFRVNMIPWAGVKDPLSGAQDDL